MAWPSIFDSVFLALAEPVLQEFPVLNLRHNFDCVAHLFDFGANVLLLRLVDHLAHVSLRDAAHFLVAAVHLGLYLLHQNLEFVAFSLPESLETLLFGAFVLLLLVLGLQIRLVVLKVCLALFDFVLLLLDLLALLCDAFGGVVNHAFGLVELVHALVVLLQFRLDAQCFTFLLHQH